MAYVYGTADDDVIHGDDDDGQAGNDTLWGFGGNDRLYGHDGASDYLIGGAGADIIDGGAGADMTDYRDSNEGVVIDLDTGRGYGGTAESDRLYSIEHVIGSDHNDTLSGTANNDFFEGSDGADILKGLGGEDSLYGGAGDDTLKGGGGADVLHGGAGLDTVAYQESPTRVFVSLLNNTAAYGDAEGDTFTYIENVTGLAYNDSLWGHDGANALNGMAGNDILKGFGGADTLLGEAGNDVLDGGSGVDTMRGGTGNDTYFVDSGSDQVIEDVGGGIDRVVSSSSYQLRSNVEVETLEADANSGTAPLALTGNNFAQTIIGNAGANTIDGRDGADWIDGGAGIDTVTYAFSTGSVAVSLPSQSGVGSHAAGDTLINIENLIGSAFADQFAGTAGANQLFGGFGNDYLDGGAGADLLNGGANLDTVTYANSSKSVAVSLPSQSGVGGDAAGDTLIDIENLIGSAFDDQFAGTAGANQFAGGGGNDFLDGGAGGDELDGGSGIDTVTYANSSAGVAVSLPSQSGVGGDAAGDGLFNIENFIGSAFDDQFAGTELFNRIDGRAGADWLTGGGGNDFFDFNGSFGNDTITDFSAGAGATDTIVLDDSQFANFDAVMAATFDDGLGNSVISHTAGSITLMGVLKAQLSVDDFVIV